MLRPLVVLGAAFGALVLPSVATAASPRSLAKQHFAVLRAAQRSGDRVPGLADAHALTRRIGRVEGRTIWLGVSGTRLCLWVRADGGGRGEACSSVARALRPGSPPAIVYGGGVGMTVAVALPDGSSDARVVSRGATTRLRIRRSAIVRFTMVKRERLVWRAPDGTDVQMPLARP